MDLARLPFRQDGAGVEIDNAQLDTGRRESGRVEAPAVGIADPHSQGGASAISIVAAKLKGDVVEPPPQLGFSGAAVLDGQGRFFGMAELKAPVVAAVGSTAAQPQATVVPLPTIRAFLDGHQLAAAGGRSGVEAAKSSLVRVICVRK